MRSRRSSRREKSTTIREARTIRAHTTVVYENESTSKIEMMKALELTRRAKLMHALSASTMFQQIAEKHEH